MGSRREVREKGAGEGLGVGGGERMEGVEMAEHEGTVFAAEVHATTFAVAEQTAVAARREPTHPCAIAIGHETMLPHVPKVIVVDIALIVLATNAGACRYAAVDEDRCDADTCRAVEEMIAHIAFVIT